MNPEAANTDIAQLSYEGAREELVAVVSALEAGAATLEQSLALWERGEALAVRCEAWLQGATARLDAARGPETQQRPGDFGMPGPDAQAPGVPG